MMLGILAAAIRRAIAPPEPSATLVLDSAWKARTSVSGRAWRDVCWSPERGLFVAVESATGGFIITSPDGINWTSRTNPISGGSLSKVVWCSGIGLFVAVGGGGVAASSDGIIWTARSAPVRTWLGLCWSPELSLIVAVSPDGTGQCVMTSPDGANWTLRQNSAPESWQEVCWAPGIGLFVAVASSGTGSRVMTSPDGINWTSRPSPQQIWVGVCWSQSLGLLVATAVSSGANGAMTSPDGINWTQRTTPSDLSLSDVVWCEEAKQFVATSLAGTGARSATSPDGITWTKKTTPSDDNWVGIAWAPALKRFVAVANVGSGSRTMTLSAGAHIQFVGSVVRHKALENTSVQSLTLPLPAGTQIGDTIVAYTQGYLYDPSHAGWNPCKLETGDEAWFVRTKQVTSLDPVVFDAASSRCVVALMVFRGAGTKPLARRLTSFYSMSPPSGVVPASPLLPEVSKFVFDMIAADSVGPETKAVQPYPSGEVLVDYNHGTMGITSTNSVSTLVGVSQPFEGTMPAITWNLTGSSMTATRWALYYGDA
jgi:hypothetical protein